MCDRYEGFSNRETWATVLWVDNDEGLYHSSREVVSTNRYLPDREVAEALKDWYNELVAVPDTSDAEALRSWTESIFTVLSDIGSDYRVDWHEIARAWLDEYDRGCWHVASNSPGFLPEGPVECYATREDAISVLWSLAEEWADEDDEGVLQGAQTLEELEGASAGTRAYLDGARRDGDLTAPDTGGVEINIPANDDSRRIFFAHRQDAGTCDHDECDHTGEI